MNRNIRVEQPNGRVQRLLFESNFTRQVLPAWSHGQSVFRSIPVLYLASAA